ncbi:MAG: phosphoadenosine phosphosulfate reductase family protein [Bacteroidales bacterium]|nr:phosphoadenosine phosphosulfate reductase family protein [Bacteroidales bacterium]
MSKKHKRKPIGFASSLNPLEDVVEEAIQFVQENAPPEGYFVAFSGGKDSICVLEIVRMAGVKHETYYSATGIDPPEVVKFIRKNYPEVKFLRPKINFWEGIYKNAPPLRKARWCCRLLKKDTTLKIPLKNRILGIREEESYSRACRPRIDYHKKLKQYLYKPIFYWKEWHVWEFIEKYNLKYPSLYNEGFDRLGCVVCPFLPSKSMSRIKLHMERWPKIYKTFEHAVTRWFNDKADNKYKQGGQTAKEYIQDWYRGFEK